MWVLGKALWSHTPWEMTRDEQGGELMFHYVRQQIRRRTTGFRRPLIWVRRAFCSMWDQDEMIMCIDRFAPVSFYLSLLLPYALSHFHSNIILHEQIIILNLLATSNGISLCFGGVWCRRARVTLKLNFGHFRLYSSATAGAVYVSILLLIVSGGHRSINMVLVTGRRAFSV